MLNVQLRRCLRFIHQTSLRHLVHSCKFHRSCSIRKAVCDSEGQVDTCPFSVDFGWDKHGCSQLRKYALQSKRGCQYFFKRFREALASLQKPSTHGACSAIDEGKTPATVRPSQTLSMYENPIEKFFHRSPRGMTETARYSST